MRYKVLIVEDDQINCLIYKHLFKETPFELDFAFDGKLGVDMYTRNNYDLVLLDMGLPKIAGYDVARLVRLYDNRPLGRSSPVPIIAVTADVSPQTRRLAIEAGVDEYVTKPFDINNLGSLINKYLLPVLL
jgi:CheY-like chemotaxis protein